MTVIGTVVIDTIAVFTAVISNILTVGKSKGWFPAASIWMT